MTRELPEDLTVRPARAEDYTQVLSALDAWCGPDDARYEMPMSRLLFEDFLATCFAAENAAGELAGFLIGSFSQSDRRAAYVHQVAVAPRVRRRGVATVLYEMFFAAVRAQGRRVVRSDAVVGAGHAMLHERLGFVPAPETSTVELDVAARPQHRIGPSDGTSSGGVALRLRILEPVFALELRADRGELVDRTWHALVRAPEGLTVIKEADPSTPEGERWIGLYDADAGHGLDVPGLLAAVVSPLAGAAVPVFVASTYHADLVLVPRSLRREACAALRGAGHEVLGLAP
ncbi:GNAT family N-acetyltransferase [Streptomyces sp. NPDC055013]